MPLGSQMVVVSHLTFRIYHLTFIFPKPVEMESDKWLT